MSDNPPTILVLDPSSVTCQQLSKKLGQLACKVLTENSSQAATEAVEEHSPDLILLELTFTDPTGMEICKAIKAVSKSANIPIVIHSGRSTRKNVLDSVRAGAISFVVKPASTETMMSKLSKAFSKIGKEEIFRESMQLFSQTLGTVAPGDGSEEESRSDVIFKDQMDNKSRINQLLRNAKEVKAMPYGVARTLEVADDERSGAKELGRVIESDTAITTMTLRRANSVHYGTRKDIIKAQEAIVRIGFEETRNLVLGISVVKNFGSETNSLGFQRGAFWEHSLAVGAIAKELARNGKAAEADLAFVAGLVHDLGKLIFDEYMHRDFERVIEAAAAEGTSLALIERAQLEINHTDVGAALLEKWKFPNVLIDVASNHHSTRDSNADLDHDQRTMARLIYVANTLAKAYRIGNSGDEMIYPIPDQILLDLNLSKGLPNNLDERVMDLVDDYLDFLGIPPRDEAASDKHTEFEDKRLIVFQDTKPLVDTIRIYLSRNWGFEIETLADLEELDQVEEFDQTVVLVQAQDHKNDRKQLEPLFTHPQRGHVILLLEPASGTVGSDHVEWPTENVTTMKKPIEGRQLITALSQAFESIPNANDEVESASDRTAA